MEQLDPLQSSTDDQGAATTSTSPGSASAAASSPLIHLGFCVPIQDEEHLLQIAHRSPDYSCWDGGQVGGRPSWLDPEHLPRQVVCRNCLPNNQKKTKSSPPRMRFICQIYAPVDFSSSSSDQQDNDHDRAFHRSLYVFACPTCCGAASSSSSSTAGCAGIRVLRAQLPADNLYFPNQEQQRPKVNDHDNQDHVTEVNWKQHEPATWKNHVCAVCGLLAVGKCPLQQTYFCGPAHQREYKLHVYSGSSSTPNGTTPTHQPNAGRPVCLPSVYHMTELVVEDEPELPPQDTVNGDETSNHGNNREAFFASNTQSKSIKTTDMDDSDDDSDDSDADLEQEDLNRITGARSLSSSTKDPVTTAFYHRIEDRPNVRNQCLRYSRWNSDNDVLWIRQDGRAEPNDIAPCPYCGGPRRFEFQLLPQMLHYLLQNRPKTNATTKKSAGAAVNGNQDHFDYDKLKQALEQTESLVQQAPPEQIPPALMDAKEAVVKRVQQELLGNGGSSNCNSDPEIDWGVVAVYTCVNSCGSSPGNSAAAAESAVDPDLGSYREEFAWVQASLDATLA